MNDQITVAAFQRALAREAEIAMDDPEAVSSVTYTALSPELIGYGFVREELDATPFVCGP